MNKLLLLCLSVFACLSVYGNDSILVDKVCVEEIEEIAEDSLTFSTSYIDDTFKSLGIISEPNIHFDLKYDTVSRYTVIVGGNVFFSNTQEENIADIRSDSIELSYVIVKKEGEKARRYSGKTHHKSVIDKPWKDCPIPSSIMEEIRKDFLIRMKYRRYRAINNDSLKGLTVMRQYQLF